MWSIGVKIDIFIYFFLSLLLTYIIIMIIIVKDSSEYCWDFKWSQANENGLWYVLACTVGSDYGLNALRLSDAYMRQ